MKIHFGNRRARELTTLDYTQETSTKMPYLGVHILHTYIHILIASIYILILRMYTIKTRT